MFFLYLYINNMVVLAASICTRGGQPLISRQFRDMSRDRAAGLLAAFPGLLSNVSKTQHTIVEDENVRYVYQPLEEFYVVLIVNKLSNILQDMETLNTFVGVISGILRVVDEREIYDNCFELISGFDEIVSLGYKENLTSAQVGEFLLMDSHEERIQEIIDRNKEMEANEASKRKAVELKMKELSRKQMAEFGVQMPDQYSQQQYQQPQQQQQVAQNDSYYQHSQGYAASNVSAAASSRKGGLQLGKKGPMMNASTSLEQPLLVSKPPQQQVEQPQRVFSEKPRIENNGILLTINEKYSCQITREGEISQGEVKGDLQVRINDTEKSHIKIAVTKGSNNVTYKTHPNVDKKLFNDQSVIALKDQTKPFPSNDQNLGVLRWKASCDEGSSLPIILTTWVNDNNDGSFGVTFEYESNSEVLDEAKIVIPIINARLESSDHDNGQLEFTDDGIILTIRDLKEHPSGSVEVMCLDLEDEEALFPMEVQFDVTETSSGSSSLQVGGVYDVAGEVDSQMENDVYYVCQSEGYYIV